MTSIDQCVSLLETQGPALFQAYEERLLRFSGNLVDLNHLRILCKGRDRREAHRAIFQYDPERLSSHAEEHSETDKPFSALIS